MARAFWNQVQNPARPLLQLQAIGDGPARWSLNSSLQGLPIPDTVNCSSLLTAIHKLLDLCATEPRIQTTQYNIEQNRLRNGALENPTADWTPA